MGVLVLSVWLKANSKRKHSTWKEQGAKEDCGVILVTHESNVLSTHTDVSVFFSVCFELNTHQLFTVAAAAQRSCKVLCSHTNWTVYHIDSGVKMDSDRPQSVCLCVFSQPLYLYIINHFTPGNVDVWLQAIDNHKKSTFLWPKDTNICR